MTRRALVLGVVSAAAVAQEREDQAVLDVLAALAQALGMANAPAFLEHFDSEFPGLSDLRRNVYALVEQWDMATSIDPLRGKTVDGKRVIELDWFLQLRAKPPSSAAVRRREMVTLKLSPKGKKWKVAELSPVSLFAAIVPEVLGSSPR